MTHTAPSSLLHC